MAIEIEADLRGWYPVECSLIEWMCEQEPDASWGGLVADLDVGEPDSAFVTVIDWVETQGLSLPQHLVRASLEHAKAGVFGQEWVVPFLESRLEAPAV